MSEEIRGAVQRPFAYPAERGEKNFLLDFKERCRNFRNIKNNTFVKYDTFRKWEKVFIIYLYYYFSEQKIKYFCAISTK